MHKVIIEYFSTGALLFQPVDARLVRVNATAAAMLRTMLDGSAESEVSAALQAQHGLAAAEAREMMDFLRNQLAVFGLDWHPVYPADRLEPGEGRGAAPPTRDDFRHVD